MNFEVGDLVVFKRNTLNIWNFEIMNNMYKIHEIVRVSSIITHSIILENIDYWFDSQELILLQRNN